MFNIPSDFVLCYKSNGTKEDENEPDPNSIEDDKKREQAKKRNWFLKQCEEKGLEMEKQHWKVCLLFS